jgi:hypothetical protein
MMPPIAGAVIRREKIVRLHHRTASQAARKHLAKKPARRNIQEAEMG